MEAECDGSIDELKNYIVLCFLRLFPCMFQNEQCIRVYFKLLKQNVRIV